MEVFDINSITGYRTREMVISDLRASANPVVILGTGRFAVSIAKTIIDNGIGLLGFIDLDEYWFEGKVKKINEKNYTCYKTSQIDGFPNFNLLLGIIDYSLLYNLKNQFKQCEIIDYLDAYDSHIMSGDFIKKNQNTLEELYISLSDDESKNVMREYIYSRYTGDVSKLSALVHKSDYLYDWKLLGLSDDDIIVDGGAYIGDSVLEIKDYLDSMPQQIFTFEPDHQNLIRLIENFTPEELQHIIPISAGLYSHDTTLKFSDSGTLGSCISEKGEKHIKVYALDEHAAFKKASVIKMDIEGSELNALIGAENLIRTNRPRMAICIYHNNKDIIDISQFLKKFDYKLYLRQHSCSNEETVLYAI